MSKKKIKRRTLKLIHKGTFSSTYHEIVKEGYVILGMVSLDNASLMQEFRKIPLTIEINYKAGEEE